jgi:replicative DNA helicase
VTTAQLAPTDGDFEGTPPHDIEAEQCTLGGMLMHADAIADVAPIIVPSDHYRPAHQMIHQAIIDLDANRQPADMVTVADLLAQRGELARIGGGAYLHTLVSSVRTWAFAADYARLVRKHAVKRRAIEKGTRIVQMGYAADMDEETLADRARAEVDAILPARPGGDVQDLDELLIEVLTSLEEQAERGIPTPWTDLNDAINGLAPGEMDVIAGRPGTGKALALDTPLPTPTGWTTMGEVQPGDWLLGADGLPTCAMAASPVMFGRECYEVEFGDRTTIVADAEHLWHTTTRASRRQQAGRQERYYWSAEQLARVKDAWQQADHEPDRLVTTGELLQEVGAEFANILRRRVIGRIPVATVTRIVNRRVDRRGTIKAYPHPFPGYSRRALLGALYTHISLPKLASQCHRHNPVVTTAEIAATLFHEQPGGARRLNHAIPVPRACQFPEQQLLLEPYTLGVWLGDGSSYGSQFTTADSEIVAGIEAEGYRVTKVSGKSKYLYSIRMPTRPAATARRCHGCGQPFTPAVPRQQNCSRACGQHMSRRTPPTTCPDCGKRTKQWLCTECRKHHGTVPAILRSLDVLENKHIPVEYLRASEAQRRTLLAGLLDTDGYVNKQGGVQFAVTDKRLACDTLELILSLGYRASMTTKRVKGRCEETSTCYMVSFSPADKVFRLTRKLSRQKTSASPRTGSRAITAVRPVPSVPVRCVRVDNADSLYLASRAWIPTHNSIAGLQIAALTAVHRKEPAVIFSMEMKRQEIMLRLIAAEGKVPYQALMRRELADDHWARVNRARERIQGSPLVIDDTPVCTLAHIRSRMRELSRERPPAVVVVDYMQLLTGAGRAENRQTEVSAFSRGLKLIAGEFDVPVIAISQLNRAPTQRSDRRPELSDLRESGSIENDASVVVLLHREDANGQETARAGEIDFIVAKNRNGPPVCVTEAFQGHYMRIVDLAPEWTPSSALGSEAR